MLLAVLPTELLAQPLAQPVPPFSPLAAWQLDTSR